jgi:hypothetical protein
VCSLPVIALALTGAALLAAPASAAPWRTAQTLSPAGETGTEPAVAVAPDGTAVVAWRREGSTGGGLRIARVAPDGTPSGSPVVLFPGDFVFGVRVGMADDGTATVVWGRDRGSDVDPVESARVSPAGQVGLPRAITPETEDASVPQLAVGGDGSAVVAWQRSSDRAILARRLAPSGALGDVQVLDPGAPGFTFESLRAATGAQGAVVVWNTATDTRGARLTPSGGIAVATRTLAEKAVEPQVGVAEDGTATVAYRDFSSGANRIVARRLFADGGLGPVRDLSLVADDVQNPLVSVGRDGTAHVLWTRNLLPGVPGNVQMRRIARDETLGVVHTLPVGGVGSGPKALATTPAGGALALVGSVEPTGMRIEGVELSPADVIAGPDLLSAQSVSATDPALAVGTSGAAYAAWRFGGSAAPVIQGASLPAPAGAPPPPPAPAPPAPAPPAAAPPAPALTRFTVAPNRVLLPRRGATPGLVIGVRVNRAALVRVAVTRQAQGRRARGRCVAPTPALIRARARACARQVPVGVLSRRVAQAGPASITVRGLRIGGRRLLPGRYRLEATAVAGAARSRPLVRTLTVVQGPR